MKKAGVAVMINSCIRTASTTFLLTTLHMRSEHALVCKQRLVNDLNGRGPKISDIAVLVKEP